MTTALRLPDPFTPDATTATAATPTCCCCCCAASAVGALLWAYAAAKRTGAAGPWRGVKRLGAVGWQVHRFYARRAVA